MKLIFIGTSHGVPEIGRQCSCTLLETRGQYYLIDAGCDLNRALTDLQIPFPSVRGLFLTHQDGDHIAGVPGFCDLISWYHTKCDPTILLPNEDCLEKMKAWASCMAPLRPLKLGTVKEGLCFEDEWVKITAFPTLHVKDSHAFLVEAEGKRVLFTGDLKDPREDFPPVDHLDAAVCEAAHFDIMHYEEVWKTRWVKQVFLNHHFGKNIDRVPALTQKMQPTPVILTHDGMEASI